MEAATYDVTLHRGTLYEDTLEWLEDGSPANLGARRARWVIASAVNALPVLEVSVPDTGASGTIGLLLTAEQTAALTDRAYFHQVIVETDTGEDPQVLLGGMMYVRATL